MLALLGVGIALALGIAADGDAGGIEQVADSGGDGCGGCVELVVGAEDASFRVKPVLLTATRGREWSALTFSGGLLSMFRLVALLLAVWCSLFRAT